MKRNKNNCKIIVNIKEQELKEKYVFCYFEQIKDKLQIKLKAINNMSQIFYYCSSLLTLPDLSKLDISNVSDMSWFLFIIIIVY